MAVATITTKGQFTLPKKIREALRLQSGDKIEVTMKGDTVILKPITKDVDSVFGFLADDSDVTLTVEEMNEAIAKHHSHSA